MPNHDIRAAADQSATGRNTTAMPTPAQLAAGNYRKGRVSIHGLSIAIENPIGTFREGVGADGKPWRTRIAADYGYIAGTRGADGDGVDVFVGDFIDSGDVWVINQIDPATGAFDEHKVMLGFGSEALARAAYTESYDRDWKGLGSMVRITVPQLRWWLKRGSMLSPLEDAGSLPAMPASGSMLQPVRWSADAEPVGKSLGRVLYEMQLDDVGDDLLTDPMTMADLLTDPDITSHMVLDALVSEVGMLQHRAEQLMSVMQAAGRAVKPQQLEVGEPVRLRGTMQVPVIYGMSDGQTLSIWFHNPDTTPAKLTPMDTLVSARWVINKKDVTIAVAPEKGQDLKPREVARRIMGLIEKNSAAFARANAKAAETAQKIDGLKAEIDGLQAELAGLNEKIARAEAVRVDRAAKAKAVPVDPTKEAAPQATESAPVVPPESVAPAAAPVEPQPADFGREDAAAQVVPIELTGKELGEFPDTPEGKKALRLAARAHADSLRGKWVFCRGLGEDVEIRQRGIKEMFAFSGDKRKLKAIAALDRIIGEAHSPIRQPNAKEDKKRSAIEYLHLESVIRLEGEEIHLRVVVERDNNGLLHYDLMIEKSVAEATKALDLESGASDAPRPIPDNHSGGDGAPILDGADEEVKKNAMIINMFFFGEVVDEGANGVTHEALLAEFDGPFAKLREDQIPPLPIGARHLFGMYSEMKKKAMAGSARGVVALLEQQTASNGDRWGSALNITREILLAMSEKGMAEAPKPAVPDGVPVMAGSNGVPLETDQDDLSTPDGRYMAGKRAFQRGVPEGNRPRLIGVGDWIRGYEDAKIASANAGEADPAADLFGDTGPAPIVPEGAESKVKTAKGTEVLTGYSVVEADRLITSHDPSTGDANPAFPPELQPRDRGRDASIAWVRKTANDLDPDLLGKSRRADSGAPIVGPDGVVESGNGRTMAVVLAYQTGRADDYRAWLEDEAAYFGLSPEKVKVMRRPVLVRIRTSEVDRAAFAVEANQDDKLAMTATEVAKADANRLTDDVVALMTEDGDLTAAANVPFLAAFLRTLGDAEAARYSTSDGKPTASLIARVQAAIFAKAYQDDRLLELTADVAKPEIANIVKALNYAAPEFIQAAAMDPEATSAATGKLTDAVEKSLNQQAVDALLGASNVIRQAKDAGQTVEEFVKQSGLFGDIDPNVAAMAVFISKNSRSAKRMGEAFKAMATFIKGELQRRQTADMFGDGDPVAFADIVAAANRELERMYGPGVETIGLFDRPADPVPEAISAATAESADDLKKRGYDEAVADLRKYDRLKPGSARGLAVERLAGLPLGREFGESIEAYLARNPFLSGKEAAYQDMLAGKIDTKPAAASAAAPAAEVEPDQEPDFDPVAAVNAAYTFDQATDEFKSYLSESVGEADYSPFATAVAMDRAVRDLGGTVSWAMVEGAVLDSAGDDAHDEGAPVLDGDFPGHPFRGNQHVRGRMDSHHASRASREARRAERTAKGHDRVLHYAHSSAAAAHKRAAKQATGKTGRYHAKMAAFHAKRAKHHQDRIDGKMVLDSAADEAWPDAGIAVFDYAGDGEAQGVIRKGGQILGRAVVGDDGKAMVYVGESGAERVRYASGLNAMWSDNDAVYMVRALFTRHDEDGQGKTDAGAKAAPAPVPAPSIKKTIGSTNVGDFIPKIQLATMLKLERGEEGQFFRDKVKELADQIASMPATYGQDGKGDQAVAHLHYFSSGADWYITEKDMDGGVDQAFGLADLGDGGELGYISIRELTALAGVELDLHWSPKTLGEIRGVAPTIAASPVHEPPSVPAADPAPEPKDIDLAAAMQMAADAARAAGIELSEWKASSAKEWSYATATIGDTSVSFGASTGGIVSINGNPFTPTGRKPNDNPAAVAESVQALVTKLTPEQPPEPEPSSTTTPMPINPPANPARTDDLAYLRAIIDGTSPDMLEPDTADKLIAIMERHGDAEAQDLAGRAIDAYQSAAMEATAGIR